MMRVQESWVADALADLAGVRVAFKNIFDELAPMILTELYGFFGDLHYYRLHIKLFLLSTPHTKRTERVFFIQISKEFNIFP